MKTLNRPHKPSEPDAVDRLGIAVLAVLVGVLIAHIGFLRSAWEEMKKPEHSVGASLSESDSSQLAFLSQTWGTRGPKETQTEYPDRTLVPFGRWYEETWSLRKNTLNGIPRETVMLETRLRPAEVAERYRKTWKKKGIVTVEDVAPGRAVLQGAHRDKDYSLRMVAKRLSDGETTQVNVTRIETHRPFRKHFRYPKQIPRPSGAKGLLVTESIENDFRMTNVTCGINRSVTAVRFELLRKMWEKGWRRYENVRDPLPGVPDFQFFHPKGGDCSVILIGTDKPPRTAVEITARWPVSG